MTSIPPIEQGFSPRFDCQPDCTLWRDQPDYGRIEPRTEGSADFQHWWKLQGESVETPNQGRGGSSGVCVNELPGSQRLLYVKRQVGHLFRSLRYPFGRPTVLRELMAYREYRRLGIRVPEVVYGGIEKTGGHWRGLLVTEELDQFVSLADWYRIDARRYWGEEIHQAMLYKLAKTLSRLHGARWRHGCLYPKHIFVRVDQQLSGSVEIALLDLEKSRRYWRMASASEEDIRQLYRHRGDMPDRDWAMLQRQYKHCLALRRAI